MKNLHTELSIPIGKKPAQELTLVVDDRDISMTIQGLKDEFEECKRHMNPDEDPLSQYCHCESGDDNKTAEEVVDEMEGDVASLTHYAEGLVKMTPMEAALAEIQKEIHGDSYKAVDWPSYFKKIPRKKDGTFAIGRIVSIYEAHGFSWEDMEAYGRKGPEMVIKTMSDTEAYLMIRTGVIESW